jgi:hypothetical protein
MVSRPRSRASWALVAAVALAAALLPMTAASAGSPSKSTFTATIAPTAAALGSTPQPPFTLTVKNTSSGNTSIGSVQVVVPPGFTVDKSQSLISMQDPAGSVTGTDWTYTWPSCSSDSPDGCTTSGSTLVQVNTPNNTGADKLPPGYSLIFPVKATVEVAGCQLQWPVAAKNSAAWSSGQLLTAQGPVPSVSVTASNPQLLITNVQPEPNPDPSVATPAVLQNGQPFDVTIRVVDSLAPTQPVCFSGRVMLSSTDTNFGSTLPAFVTFTGTSAELTTGETISGVIYTGYGNDIQLSASASGASAGYKSIDVYQSAVAAFGSSTAPLSDPNCVVSSSNPVCATLLLPNGAASTVTLAQGSCNPYTSCLAPGAPMLVDARADLGGLYGKTNPATLVLECDKSLCGQGGVNSYPIWFQSSDGNTILPQIPACPSKGTLGDTIACQDFVQNHRDNAGNLIAYVLFDEDAKATFP